MAQKLQVKIKKPTFDIKKVKFTKLKNIFTFFYNQEEFSRLNFPMKLSSLLGHVFLFSSATLLFRFALDYVRSEGDLNEIVLNIVIINYSLWLALALYLTGLFFLLYVGLKILKQEFDFKTFLINNYFIAAFLYFGMKFLSLLIILADELLPFELTFNRWGVNFSLLTILFLAQILIVIIVNNFWQVFSSKYLNIRKIFSTLIGLILSAAIWTLISP